MWKEQRRTGTRRGKNSGGMVETRIQKFSRNKGTKFEEEIHRSPAQNENQAGRGTEGKGTRRLTSDSTLVEHGHELATSTGTLDREEISEDPAGRGSPTDKNMMHGMTEEAETSSSFSERVKITLVNFFPFTMRTGTSRASSSLSCSRSLFNLFSLSAASRIITDKLLARYLSVYSFNNLSHLVYCNLSPSAGFLSQPELLSLSLSLSLSCSLK